MHLTYGQTTEDPDQQSSLTYKGKVVIGFIISFLAVSFVTYGVHRWVNKKKSNHFSNRPNSFWNIIRGSDNYPSLAYFQFLIWTFIISFSMLGIYLGRIFNGQIESIPEISINILALLGISIFVPVISKTISDMKYAKQRAEYESDLPGYHTMLEENGKLSLTRFQMFLWTWISVLIYVSILFQSTVLIFHNIDEDPTRMIEILKQFKLPDIDPILVYLMGLSQGGYLAAKYISQPALTIAKILFGKKVTDTTGKGILTILGNGFGYQYGKVIINNSIIDAKEDLPIWTNEKIDVLNSLVNIPVAGEGEADPQPTKYLLKVMVGSQFVENEFSIDKNGVIVIKP